MYLAEENQKYLNEFSDDKISDDDQNLIQDIESDSEKD
jgi:hypothetical protein